MLFILADILLLALFGLFLSILFKRSCAEIIYANWNVQIPARLTEVYENQGEPSFHGDGPRYHVFLDSEYEDHPEFYSSFSDGKNPGAEEFIVDVLTELEVPQEEWPDFSHPYRWWTKKGDGFSERLYFLYDEGTGKLYVAEYFT